MKTIQCPCGAVDVRLEGEPLAQFYCHCDHCQTVHGKACPCALYVATAVTVTRGDTATFTLESTPRTKCASCNAYLFAEVPGYGVTSVNGDLLPKGSFEPAFHAQCRFASTPIDDALPHYRDRPAALHGTGELMTW